MNLTPAFIRKVLYLAAMVPPLLVLVYLGMPDVHGGGDKPSALTGRLAQLRNEYHLSPANLGEIDPASETMRLSTLGLRGVAVNVLWNEAHKYKKMRDFDKLSATVNQIVLLQPNFITVWEYQAHNLSYNVSVEFDDYRDRYNWVTKGITFLMSGTEYNLNEPRLMSQCGWFISQKIGQSDEFRQYRRLFRRDTDFHNEINRYVNVDDAKSRADFLPDNWLVARLWYLKAERVVETRNARARETPWLFFSHAPRALISYAKALDRDGDLPPDDVSQQAWRVAGDKWDEYGQREFFVIGIPARLNMLETRRGQRNLMTIVIVGAAAELSDEDLEKLRSDAWPLLQGGAEVQQAADKLADAFPAFHRQWTELNEEKRAKLSPRQIEALNIHPDIREAADRRVAAEAKKMLELDPGQLLTLVPESRRAELTDQYNKMMGQLGAVEQLNTVSKYDYWKLRCEMEATSKAREAKRLLYEARNLAQSAKLESAGDEPGAKELFERAWDKWHEIFVASPRMYENVEESQSLLRDLEIYDGVLSKLDEPPLPYDFKLRRLIDSDEALWNGRALQPRPREVTAPVRKTDESGEAPKPAANEPSPEKTETPKAESPKAEAPKPESKKPDAPEAKPGEPSPQKTDDEKTDGEKTDEQKGGDKKTGGAKTEDAKGTGGEKDAGGNQPPKPASLEPGQNGNDKQPPSPTKDAIDD